MQFPEEMRQSLSSSEKSGLSGLTCRDELAGLHGFRALLRAGEEHRPLSDGSAAATDINRRVGALVALSVIPRLCDDRSFMIAAVLTWGSSELTLERAVERCFRLIPNVTGDFRYTSGCLFQ